MAWNSNYFDTLLASGMEESITKQVTLEDVSPETFELAMELIDDMGRASKATVADFIQVASFYNRFDFQNGLDRCISALVEFMELWHANLSDACRPKKADMENILATICFAAETEAEDLNQICLRFLWRAVGGHGNLFDVDRWRQIQVFLVNHKTDLNWGDVNDPEFPSLLAGRQQKSEFYRCLMRVSFTIGLKVETNGSSEEKSFKIFWQLAPRRGSFFGSSTRSSVYEGSNFRNVRLFQIDQTYEEEMSYEEEMECERFDWCVSFEWRGNFILLALPQSRNTPNPAGSVNGWEQVKGVRGIECKITSFDFSV